MRISVDRIVYRKAKLARSLILILSLSLISCSLSSRTSYVGEGWAKNSVNTVIFRKNSLTSKDDVQFISYYDPEGNLVLGKRNIDEQDWQINTTPYKANVEDAHNAASMEVDGDGFLHVAWDHHNTALRYAKSIEPGALDLTEEMPMIGSEERVVSYPEFYRMPTGDLLFLYRDGGSGNGNLVINKYDHNAKTWNRIHANLIDGEGERNAYWQACVDPKGAIHISWVWRETPDVASNHDMHYARSRDGGITWETSDGTLYEIPITKASVEIIHGIPQNRELINQTSMTTNDQGDPFIVSYWTPENSNIPQYQLLYRAVGKWNLENLNFRSQPFSFSGMGTKQIPISRPQIVVTDDQIYVIFRDAERNNKVSIASNAIPFEKEWTLQDYTEGGYNSWEPTLDPHIWEGSEKLSLLLQQNVQVDGEGLSEKNSAPIQVLDIKLK